MSTAPIDHSPPALRLEELYFTYPDGVQALRGVDLTIHKGERVALIGANGSGKSTLLKQLNGLLRSPHGRVVVGGLELSTSSLTEIRRQVGFVFQDANDQLFCPTVAEDVAFGPLHLGLPMREVLQRVRCALEQVGLSEFSHRVPQRLSAGEKSLAALATVLACQPEILVLDEPTATLDPYHRRRMIDLLRSIPVTQLIATHDLDLAWELCPRVVILRQGRIVQDNSASLLLSNAELLKQYQLELPLQLQGLASSPISDPVT
ncbi:MAG: Cobalt import ATP-binding protein CbiO [Phycisphaerae bacterium]|nr:Cobalt import ATP-binding protein CbiO [Phycisphaerae bacterium]